MKRTPVSSSNLESVGFDVENNILEIEFNSGGVYKYFDVPKVVFEQLMSASSHGKFFHREVKGNFRFERVS